MDMVSTVSAINGYARADASFPTPSGRSTSTTSWNTCSDASSHLVIPGVPLRHVIQRYDSPGLVKGTAYDASMAYDEDLAQRIREAIGPQRGVTEKKMFGGLAFLIGGNMAVAASGQGGILVRVDPDDSDRLVAKTKAEPMVMRGKPMQGWLRVDPEHLRDRRQLARWVERGTSYARSLPAKG
jgi:TfoX/Sxy family transcriptional regulator of competence genes